MGDTQPRRIGPYELRSRLLGGGGGAVHSALDRAGREVVVKLHERGAGELAGLAEASLLGLEHPGLAVCLDAGRTADDGVLYTVTERVIGEPMGPGSLAACSAEDAVLATARLLAALGALHDLRRLHRDLKPDNVFLEQLGGRPVLLDFGLGCSFDEARSTALAGTPRAMAPELFAGSPASQASDLWAAGLLLAEALLGRQLVGHESLEIMAAERLTLRIDEAALTRRLGRSDLPRLVARLLEPDPAGRPVDVPTALATLGLDDPRQREALDREALLAGRSAALARADPRRRGRLEALARDAAWVDLCPSPEIGLEGAFQELAVHASPLADDPEVRRRLGAEGRSPRELAALATALGRHIALVLQVCSSDAVDAGSVGERQELVRALTAALDGTASVLVSDPAAPDGSDALAVLSHWLGHVPLLAERARAAPPTSWRALDDATRELVRRGVVRRSALGIQLDETVLPECWPEPGEQAAPSLPAEALELLDLLCLSPHPLAVADLEELTGAGAAPSLDVLVGAGLVQAERSAGRVLWRPMDERLRRARVGAEALPDGLRSALAQRLVPAGAAPDEVQAAQVARLLGAGGAHLAGVDDPGLSALALACGATLRRVGRLELAEQLLTRGLRGARDGGDPARALGLERIDVLLRHGAYDRAEAALSEAEAQWTSDPALAMRRGRVLALRGRLGEALALLEQVDPDALEGDDAVLALQLRAGVLHGLGRSADGLVDLREALRRQGERPDRRAMTLLERMGFLERELGQHERAIRSFEKAMAMAKELGHDALVWSPLYNIGKTIRDRGDKRRGLAIQEQAAVLCEQTGNRVGLTSVLNSLGAGWLTLGRVDLARRHLARALELARDVGNRAVEAMVHNNLGTALAAEGRLEEALASWAASLAIRTALGDRQGQAAVHLTRGGALALRERFDDARVDLGAARIALEGLDPPNWQTVADLLEARVALADRRPEDAARAAGAARDRAKAHGLRPELLQARGLLAQLDRDDLADLDADEGEAGPWTAEALLGRAGLRVRAGRPDDALADLDRATAVLHESPHDLVELALLLLRLELDLAALAEQLERSEPAVAAVGALLSDISRDLDRARALASLHGPPASGARVDALSERFAAMDHDDVHGLASLAERMRDLERLAEITKRLTAERDTQKLLDLIIDAAVELTGAARGFLILIDGRAEEFRAARGLDEGTIAHPEFQVSHSVARQVVRNGQPLLTANAVDDPRLTTAASISELKLLSILCVPMAWRGRVLGAVYLDHPRVVGRFRDSHLETVSRLAEQAAVALENARLAEGLEQTNSELESRRAEVARLNEALQERLQRREAELERTRESLDASRRALALRYDYSSIITRSERMHEVLDLLDRVTDTDFPVMILGESGTGKELLARAVHFNGPRRERNFLSINCAAFAEPLIESELFGSMKGAFTGADRDRKGLFAQAHEGTLFLDEIGDMSLDVQKRLLRVLQEGEFLPVGGREVVKVDVRILCATHRNLEQRVAEGLFRDDLYYRLAVARVALPPLRERPEDLALLLPHFLELHGSGARTIEPEALALLEARPWPGNVRELENFAMNLMLFDREGDHVSADLVRRLLGEGRGLAGDPPVAPVVSAATGSLKDRLEAFELAQVRAALESSAGNKAAAARALGVPVRTLYKMIERLGI